jgi:hypothetical protein
MGDAKHNEDRLEAMMPLKKKKRQDPPDQDFLQMMHLMALQIEDFLVELQ